MPHCTLRTPALPAVHTGIIYVAVYNHLGEVFSRELPVEGPSDTVEMAFAGQHKYVAHL